MSTAVSLRIVVAVALLVLGAGSTLLPAGGWGTTGLLLSAALLIAVALADARMSVIGALPVALTMLLVVVASWGLISPFLPVTWTSRPFAIATWWSILLLGFAVALSRRRATFALVGLDLPVAIVGLFVMALFAGLAALQPTEVWLRHVALGTDFARHVTILDTTVNGGIDLMGGSVYPRGVHALVGVAWRVGGGTQFGTAWSALQGCLVLFLAVMAMGLTAASRSWARSLSLSRLWIDWLIPMAIVVAVIQGMWLAAMMASGLVTSLAAGLILAALVSVIAVARSFATSWLVSMVAMAAAAMAYSWPILVAIPAVVAVAGWVASGFRWRGGLALFAGAVIAAPSILALALLTVTSQAYRGEILADAPVLLWWPEWWWWLLAVLGLAMILPLARADRGSGMALVVALAAASLTVVCVAVLTGATIESPGYYLLKTLWTASNLILPAGLVGGAWVIAITWRKATLTPSPYGTVLRGTVVASVVILVAAALGRLTANAQTWNNFTKGFGEVPLTYVLLAHLESQGVSPRPGQAVSVWGLSPYATLGNVQNAGMLDRYATDAVRWLEPDIVRPDVPVTVARDAVGMCRFLSDNRDALRITGPSDEPGIKWLRAAGCPENVIRSGEWIQTPIADDWFIHLAMAGQPYDYPEWIEYRDQMRMRDPEWGS